MNDAGDVQVFAVIPAAGQSKRMGRPKQLLPLGGRTLLEQVIEAVLEGEINGLCVVVSSAIDNELLLREDPRFITAVNDDAGSQMLDSILIGWGALRERRPVHDPDACLVCPGDMPGVSPQDCRALTREYREHPGCIVIATHAGARGHPVVFPLSMSNEARRITEGGLRVLIERHADCVRRVERDAPGVVADVNTPADWARWEQQVHSE